MPADARAPTKADELTTHIRQLILEGHFEPGDDLTEEALKAKLPKVNYKDKFSPHPLRQALADLEKEGFVEIKPQAWTRVRYVNIRELRAIWDNRAVLEEFIACQLARKRGPGLERAEIVNKEMRDIAWSDSERTLSHEDQKRFVELDVSFHDALAKAADYAILAEQLQNLRQRLHQRVFPSLYSDPARMKEVVREHSYILDAISRGRGGERPDINEVQLAVRTHLRNSAKRWRIEQELRYRGDEYERDFIFDLPDSFKQTDAAGGAVPEQHVFAMRLALEFSSVVELCAREDRDLSTVENLNREMAAISRRCSEGGSCSDTDIGEFINLDIGFHAALAFLSGLLFAEDGIIHAWKRMSKHWRAGLKTEDMPTVVKEHNDILAALRTATRENCQDAVRSMRIHLMNAVTRRPLDPPFDPKLLGGFVRAMTAWVTSSATSVPSRPPKRRSKRAK